MWTFDVELKSKRVWKHLPARTYTIRAAKFDIVDTPRKELDRGIPASW